MGAVSIDTEKNSRNYQTKYALDTADGVALLLEEYTSLSGRRFIEGDYDACDILIDLEEAIKRAELTDRQRLATELYFIQGYDSYEMSSMMGVKHNNALQYATRATEKIAKIFAEWRYNEV